VSVNKTAINPALLSYIIHTWICKWHYCCNRAWDGYYTL